MVHFLLLVQMELVKGYNFKKEKEKKRLNFLFLVSFWDKDSKQRLKTLPKANGTISCTAFNSTGNIFCYAVSYDWTKVIHIRGARERERIY